MTAPWLVSLPGLVTPGAQAKRIGEAFREPGITRPP
jgi:hypothetical protein